MVTAAAAAAAAAAEARTRNQVGLLGACTGVAAAGHRHLNVDDLEGTRTFCAVPRVPDGPARAGGEGTGDTGKP